MLTNANRDDINKNLKVEGGRRVKHKENSKNSFDLTIITVVFNGSNYIRQTIHSVLNNKSTETEYIIIDGNSKDNTIEIIKEYDEQIDYWVSEPDNGIYDAMNKAISLANGQYLLFLNAQDELIIPINTISYCFHKSYYIIYGKANIVNAETRRVEEVKGEEIKNHEVFFKRMPTCHQAIFYKKESFPGYDTSYSIIADRIATYHLINQYGLQNTLFIEKKICNYYRGGFSDINQIRFAKEKINFRRHMHKNTLLSEIVSYLNINLRYKYSFFQQIEDSFILKMYRRLNK